MHAKKGSNPLLIVVIVLMVAIIALLVVLLVIKPGKSNETGNTETVTVENGQNGGNVPRIGRAEGLTVVEDPDALKKTVQEMYKRANEPGIGLEFKNDAFSNNGIDFSCYIANAVSNSYDMYLQIFADDALEDEIFLSGLVAPGEAFDHISLSHALETGTHRVFVAFTQVEETNGVQSIHAQTLFTMDFHVN
jgi:hypothetical protein